MLSSSAHYEITWEKLPDDFVLDDEPVDNINQPSLAAALSQFPNYDQLWPLCHSESKDSCESPRLGIHPIDSGSTGRS
jgi:hypothetical protein